jgi:hypothetical protein
VLFNVKAIVWFVFLPLRYKIEDRRLLLPSINYLFHVLVCVWRFTCAVEEEKNLFDIFKASKSGISFILCVSVKCLKIHLPFSLDGSST